MENHTAQVRILVVFFFFFFFFLSVNVLNVTIGFVHFLHIVAKSPSVFPK